MKRPVENGVGETVATSDLVPSDTTYSATVSGEPVQTVDSVAGGAVAADASSSVLPISYASSAAGGTPSAAVADAAVDCESTVTGSSSSAVA